MDSEDDEDDDFDEEDEEGIEIYCSEELSQVLELPVSLIVFFVPFL